MPINNGISGLEVDIYFMLFNLLDHLLFLQVKEIRMESNLLLWRQTNVQDYRTNITFILFVMLCSLIWCCLWLFWMHNHMKTIAWISEAISAKRTTKNEQKKIRINKDMFFFSWHKGVERMKKIHASKQKEYNIQIYGSEKLYAMYCAVQTPVLVTAFE